MAPDFLRVPCTGIGNPHSVARHQTSTDFRVAHAKNLCCHFLECEGGNMKSSIARSSVAICLFALLPMAWAQDQPQTSNPANQKHKFQITSTTFSGGGTIPLSMVWNQCSAYPGGADLSPQLSWTNPPRKTRSFIVVAYDVTASFTHWGMYNVAPSTTALPQGAGVARS